MLVINITTVSRTRCLLKVKIFAEHCEREAILPLLLVTLRNQSKSDMFDKCGVYYSAAPCLSGMIKLEGQHRLKSQQVRQAGVSPLGMSDADGVSC